MILKSLATIGFSMFFKPPYCGIADKKAKPIQQARAQSSVFPFRIERILGESIALNDQGHSSFKPNSTIHRISFAGDNKVITIFLDDMSFFQYFPHSVCCRRGPRIRAPQHSAKVAAKALRCPDSPRGRALANLIGVVAKW